MPESWQAVICLVLPLVLVGVLVLWMLVYTIKSLQGKKPLLRRRTRRGRPWEPMISARPAIVEVVESASHVVAETVAQVVELQVMETSIVAQVTSAVESVVEAIGYTTVRLASLLREMPIVRKRTAGETVNIVCQGREYSIEISTSSQKPDSYGGPTVHLSGLKQPLALDITVHAPGMKTVGEQHQTLNVIHTADSKATRITLIPQETGESNVQVEVFYEGRWTQMIELPVQVEKEGTVKAFYEASARGAKSGLKYTQSIEGSTTLPLPDDFSVPADVHLAIRRGSERDRWGNVPDYQAWLHRQGEEPSPLTVRITGATLDDANEAMREVLTGLSENYSDQVTLDEEPVEELEELAKLGNAILEEIFPDPEERGQLCSILRDATAIEISADRFFLPWELLYENYDPHDLSYHNFWGFKYNICRVVTDVRQRPGPTITYREIPTIDLFFYDGQSYDLPNIVEKEVPFFSALGEYGRIALNKCPALDNSHRSDALVLFSQFCQARESQIVHFACHAEAQENVFRSYLTVADDFDIELLDMRVHKCRMSGNPLVVLNACGTGIRDSRGSFGFVRMFFECGGRGIIATENDIPDAFSAAFAESLYSRLLKGEIAGKALLETRLFFLNKHRNPLGLLYASYAAMGTRLVRESS
jgi:hypothetical protein